MLSNPQTAPYRHLHQLRHLQIPLSRHRNNVHPRRVNSSNVCTGTSKRVRTKAKAMTSMWAPTWRRPTRATVAASLRRIYRTARSVSPRVSAVRHMNCTHLRRSMPPSDPFRRQSRRQLCRFLHSQPIHISRQDFPHFVSCCKNTRVFKNLTVYKD